MGKNEPLFDPKSATILEKWLDGNRIYTQDKPKNFKFGPGTAEGQQHFTLNLHKTRNWFTNPSDALGCWDSFSGTSFADESRMNTITRLIIVAFVLLIIVGVREWTIVLIVGLFLILILWYTLIPTVTGSIHTKKAPKVQYLRCHASKHRRHGKRSKPSFSLFHTTNVNTYHLLPKNHKHI